MRSDFVATTSRYSDGATKVPPSALLNSATTLCSFANESLTSCGVERHKWLQERTERRADYLDPIAW
jgi:hypothetical protein